MSAASTLRHPHLAATATALFITAAVLILGDDYARHLETHYIHALAPLTTSLKNQGLALPRVALAQPDLLPLYGSSELVKDVPDKASLFFKKYPTDFAVFPVGKAGTTSLVILQKLAAVGPEIRERKVAISISPGWFFTEAIPAHYYEGNFSVLQASEFIGNGNIDPALRRDAARRMLDFPESLTRHPLLAFTLRRLAGNSPVDRALCEVTRPLCALESTLIEFQDHFRTVVFILIERHHVRLLHRRHELVFNWARLLAHARRQTEASGIDPAQDAAAPWHARVVGGDAGFLETLARAHEWNDLELLLRGLRDLGVKPLLLSMPINGPYYDRIGVSPAARAAYYARLRALAGKYEMPLADFRAHEEDRDFLVDHHDHLSAEGWMYYNAALDAFFHHRPLPL